MDQFLDSSLIARAEPVFRPNMPIETWVYGDDANSNAPLFGGETLMSARQVADALGVSLKTLNSMIARGVGPPLYRFGPRLRRFLPSIVRDWAKHCVEIEIAEFANSVAPGGDCTSSPGSLTADDEGKTRAVATRPATRPPCEVERCIDM